jgi:hypothetical protein
MLERFYDLFVVAHILGAFIFAMAHGVNLFVAFRIRSERDVDRIRAYLELSGQSIGMTYAGLAILLVAGIATAVMHGWFGFLWTWLALGLVIVLAILMFARGSLYYGEVRHAVGLKSYQDKPDAPAPRPLSPETVARLLDSRRPEELAIVGGLGLGIIVWLMVAKPF